MKIKITKLQSKNVGLKILNQNSENNYQLKTKYRNRNIYHAIVSKKASEPGFWVVLNSFCNILLSRFH